MPEKLNILIVEDEQGVAETLKNTIEKTVNSSCTTAGFEYAAEIFGSQFDAVVLDQFQGDPALGMNAGQPLWKVIQDNSFLPVVVYSAEELVLDETFPVDNPILIHVRKGAGSDQQLAEHLKAQRNVLLALKHIKTEFSTVLRGVLTTVAPAIMKASGSDSETKAVQLARAARRRVAAMMDLNFQTTGEGLYAWEQYICPPLNDQWLTGDILFLRGSDPKDPTNYRVLLTPSCDLPRPSGTSKIARVLVCSCTKIDEYLKAANIPPNKLDRLASWLTRPHAGGMILLPAYHDQIPCMTAKLKELDLIPIGEIGQVAKYVRVASIDSPFREQIGWAFTETHGRPAVPDRDLAMWIKEIEQDINRAIPQQNQIIKDIEKR